MNTHSSAPNDTAASPPQTPGILFCNCAYAQIVPAAVKKEVLRQLCASGVAFEAVGDLCEMSARRDPALARLSLQAPVKIAACFPRAVKWLFAAAGAPLPAESAEVLNMRTLSAEEIVQQLLNPAVRPNLPAGKTTRPAE